MSRRDKYSPLFRTASRQMQQAAHADFRRTTFGRLLEEAKRIQHTYRAGQHPRAMFGRLISKYGQGFDLRRCLRELAGTGFAQLIGEVERYARGSGAERAFVSQFLGALGPAGKLLQALLQPGGMGGTAVNLERDLQSAADFLSAHGWLAIPPPGYRGVTRPGMPKRTTGVAGMVEALQELGFTVIAPDEEITRPEAAPQRITPLPWGISPTRGGKLKKTVSFRYGNRQRTLPATHPALTGEMVRTGNSTNVYAIGYDIEAAYLYVRFHDWEPHKGKRDAPGPLYRYSPIDLDQFLSLYRTRGRGDQHGGDSSPGTWVWSHLRVRGSHTAHQPMVNYELVGVSGDYVPRQAKVLTDIEAPLYGLPAGGEAWVKRRVHTTHGQFVQSVLKNKLLRPWRVAGPRG